MPYCPVCCDEFEDWVKVCPDCNVPLVEELPPKPEHKVVDEPLVNIATAPNEAIASMWAGILEEHGIHCLLKGGDLAAAMYASPLNVPYEISVLASNADRATQILTPFIES
jgi:hypothetical protein